LSVAVAGRAEAAEPAGDAAGPAVEPVGKQVGAFVTALGAEIRPSAGNAGAAGTDGAAGTGCPAGAAMGPVGGQVDTDAVAEGLPGGAPALAAGAGIAAGTDVAAGSAARGVGQEVAAGRAAITVGSATDTLRVLAGSHGLADAAAGAAVDTVALDITAEEIRSRPAVQLPFRTERQAGPALADTFSPRVTIGAAVCRQQTIRTVRLRRMGTAATIRQTGVNGAGITVITLIDLRSTDKGPPTAHVAGVLTVFFIPAFKYRRVDGHLSGADVTTVCIIIDTFPCCYGLRGWP